jgi:CheY-like chemotaxis protein
MMAGLNGLELLDAVRAKLPAMAERIVFITGGAWDPELRARLEALPNERLEKPVSLLALREVIRRRSQVA